ncbi:hypothetical protein HMPREF0987_02229 [Lachnospiraceae bacterium 9_1_43BFAA]|nr:hypothetical protein HMPREF0987_02229 [Lachnospiraceae bacterium 9_1_43BFAA]
MKNKKIMQIGISLSLVGMLGVNGTLPALAAEVKDGDSAIISEVQEEASEDVQEPEMKNEETQPTEEGQQQVTEETDSNVEEQGEDKTPVEEEQTAEQSVEQQESPAEIEMEKQESEKSQNGFIINSDGELLQYTGSETRVVVPSNVKRIGALAFTGNKNIEEVVLPNGVQAIGRYAFSQCSNLKEITIPASLKVIQEGSLNGTGVETVVLPENVTEIGPSAFGFCKNLEKINIPEGITELSDEVFLNCAKLKDVTIPNSVKTISQYAFYGTGVETVILPDSVTEVRRSAFASCPNLKRIEFSREIKSIGDYAVNNTGNLNTVVFKGDAPSIGKDVFSSRNNCPIIEVPKGAKGYDQKPWTNYKIVYTEGVRIPEAVTDFKSIPAGKQKVKLTWNSAEGAEGYLIYAQKNGKYGYVGMTTKGTTFTDAKALDTDYNYYWVFPYVTDTNTGKMLPGKCTKYVWAKGVIPAVQNLKASSVKGGVKLTWTEQKDAEGYLVYGQRAGEKYGYVGMTTKGTTFTDTKASKTAYNYYWVFPYHKDSQGNMIVGGTPKYTYGRAL